MIDVTISLGHRPNEIAKGLPMTLEEDYAEKAWSDTSDEVFIDGQFTGYAPVTPDVAAPLLTYFSDLRKRFFNALLEIDLTLQSYGQALDALQPRVNEKLGLAWIRRADRYNGARYPVVVRWLMRKFGDKHQWFYTVLPVKDMPRRVKRSGPFAKGSEMTRHSVRRVAELMERRQKLLAHLADLRRAVSALEEHVTLMQAEREILSKRLPEMPYYTGSAINKPSHDS
ncbi:hypothetical protein HAP93_11285 [Acidithiobacillus ferriphilus]|uniref:hypothetical protein n=1 Tax=Acidithiobacillus ferriphilus TaxID=1689834 RepID=UPI001C06341F|nr:hypothetical protein [Acidithiobacillus ferriphilus]MBU2786331.1 hypothetical protein [Acidithiobacillus ferriphilus]MBU2816685.1 hypothetical protein [Acidithiobacillus ferrooxidans]